MPKGFYTLTKPKFKQLIEYIDNANTKSINRLLDNAPFTSINPITNEQKANAVLWDGNIVIEKP